MKVIDYIVLGILLISIILGLIFGLSKRIRRSPFGIVSILFALATTYTIVCMLLAIPQFKNFLDEMNIKMLEANNPFLDFLVNIRINLIALIIIVLIIVLLVKHFVFNRIADLLELDNKLSKVLNKVFGVIYSVIFSMAIILVAFQIVFLINGTSGVLYDNIQGSLFKLDYIYENNPIVNVFRYFKTNYTNLMNMLEASSGII